MKLRPNRISKTELRQRQHLTVPPRLEGVVKNASMNPVRKRKVARPVKKPYEPMPESSKGGPRISGGAQWPYASA